MKCNFDYIPHIQVFIYLHIYLLIYLFINIINDHF